MRQKDRSLFLVGTFCDEAMRCAEEASASVGISLAVVSGCADAPKALAEATEPLAIVVRMGAEGAAQLLAHARAQAHLVQLPILGVASRREDLVFTELFSWGGDDLLALASAPSFARRLRLLMARAPSRERQQTTPERCAVVGGADARWRSIVGRALYQGGFSVRFFASADDLHQESLAASVALLVLADDLGPGQVVAALQAARAQCSQAPWIVVTPPKRMGVLRAATKGLGPVSVADGFAPPENVLFLANELLSRRGVNKRSSPRVLYGTTVAFRPAGRDEDEIGFSYNVSASGVYVRTLAPLDAGQEVWLEMWPPRSDRRVRLAGTVAWKRPFGPNEGETVPTGFGVRVTEGLPGDLGRWRVGCEAFAETLLGAVEAAACT